MLIKNIMLYVLLAALCLGISSAPEAKQSEEQEWQRQFVARIDQWVFHGVSAAIADEAKARLLFRQHILGRFRKWASRLHESVKTVAEDLLNRQRKLLMILDSRATAGRLAGDQGLVLIRSLRQAERSVVRYMQAAEELIQIQLTQAMGAMELLGQQSRTFDALRRELENLHGVSQVSLESFGTSAKFIESGKVSRARFHIFVQYPRVWQELPKQDVIACARRVAKLLKAPEVVHRWIDFLDSEDRAVPALGFGVDDEEAAAKIYVMTRVSENWMPNLPVRGLHVEGLHSFLPITKDAVPQMVSLEWSTAATGNDARLRHYWNDRDVPVEERLSEQVVRMLHPRSTSQDDAAVRHKQGLVSFLGAVGAEIELVSSADIRDGLLASDAEAKPSKLGFLARASDHHFMSALEGLLAETVLERHLGAIREWVAASARVCPHLLSNVQMGHDRHGHSYISVYRHPTTAVVVSMSEVQRRVVRHQTMEATSRLDDGGDESCQTAFDTLSVNLMTCNPRQMRDVCPSGCDSLIQQVLQRCQGCKHIRRQRCGNSTALRWKDERAEGELGACPAEAVVHWHSPVTAEDVVAVVELWGPPGCSLKHGNAYAYLAHSTQLCERGCETARGLADFALSDLLCGSEACFPGCKEALLRSCEACGDREPPPQRRDDSCEAPPSPLLWNPHQLHGGLCGETCEQVRAAQAKDFECRRRLCSSLATLNSSKLTGERRCEAAKGQAITDAAGAPVTEQAVCSQVGGRAGKELSCGEVDAMLRPPFPRLAHPGQCERLGARLVAEFGARCCTFSPETRSGGAGDGERDALVHGDD